MSTGTLAVGDERARSFGEDEPGTGRRADVGVLASGFWANRSRRRPEEPSAIDTAVELDASEALGGDDELDAPAPFAKPPRKVAAISGVMRRVLDMLEPLARAELTVTLIGETGTGKDVLARMIHQNSPRRNGPFVVFDCGAVAANLAESELLGHERGAFTGAVTAHSGAFERAHNGTLFLDEIGELPLDLQTRLLRLLGNCSVRRVGGTQDRPFDVRIVAATNRDLQAEVSAGRFRRDLYFRLATAVVHVPPLRERPEDIPVLATRLLEDLGHREVRIAPDALRLLASRHWRGNVRELKNTMACAVAFLDGTVLEARHLAIPSSCEEPAPDQVSQLPLAGIRLECIERAAIEQTLRQTGGNKARASELLGIAPSTLYEKLKKYQRAISS